MMIRAGGFRRLAFSWTARTKPSNPWTRFHVSLSNNPISMYFGGENTPQYFKKWTPSHRSLSTSKWSGADNHPSTDTKSEETIIGLVSSYEPAPKLASYTMKLISTSILTMLSRETSERIVHDNSVQTVAGEIVGQIVQELKSRHIRNICEQLGKSLDDKGDSAIAIITSRMTPEFVPTLGFDSMSYLNAADNIASGSNGHHHSIVRLLGKQLLEVSEFVSNSIAQTQHRSLSHIVKVTEKDPEEIHANLQGVGELVHDSINKIISGQLVFRDITGHHRHLMRTAMGYTDDYSHRPRGDSNAWNSEVDKLYKQSMVSLQNKEEVHRHRPNVAGAANKSYNVEDSLLNYAKAATIMGKKEWVKQGHEWMIENCVAFFRKNGLRRFYINQELLRYSDQVSDGGAEDSGNRQLSFNNVEFLRDVRLDLESKLAKDVMKRNDSRDCPPLSDSGNAPQHPENFHKIRVLDVGSCFNPLHYLVKGTENEALFDITGVDLFPNTDRGYSNLHSDDQAQDVQVTQKDPDNKLYQCDFLNLNITSPDVPPCIEYAPTTKETEAAGFDRLLSQPKESFDVVTMSLVLSYLPSPQLRLKMIQQARSVLCDNTSSLGQAHPHYGGLLLIFEKPSIFNKDALNSEDHASLLHNWKMSIKQCGFEFVRYRRLTVNGKKCNGFIFKAVPFNGAESAAVTATSPFKLWIKQDFQKNSANEEDVEEDDGGLSDEDFGEVGDGMEDITRYPKGRQAPRAVVKMKHAMGLGRRPPLDKQIPDATLYASAASEQSSDKPLIAIVGGGLGGAALALSLQRRNLNVKIFEKDPHFHARKQGYALTIQQGSKALRSIGLKDDQNKLMQNSVSSFAHLSHDKHGKVIGAYGPMVKNGVILGTMDRGNGNALTGDSLDGDGPNEFSSPEAVHRYIDRLVSRNANRHNIHLPRQKLRELICDELDPSIFSWGKKLTGFEERTAASRGNNIDMRFDDGSSCAASVLIAADGIYSNVMTQVHSMYLQKQGQATSPPSPLGSLNYLGIMVILGISSNLEATSYFVGNRRFRKQMQWVDGCHRVFTMPYSDTHTMWQLSFPLGLDQAVDLVNSSNFSTSKGTGTFEGMYNHYPTGSGSVLKSVAMDILRDWDPLLLDLIARTEDGFVSGHPAYDRDPGRSVELLYGALGKDSCVTLLGDAAHPMSPFKGQGANQALIDAISLAKCLAASDVAHSSKPPLPLLLRDYEREMVDRSAHKVAKSRDSAIYLHSEHALAEGNITRAMAAEGNVP